MPDTAPLHGTSVTPQLVVSRPVEEAPSRPRQRSQASRRRSSGPRPVYQEHARSSSSEWIDVDDSPPRPKPTSRRTQHPADRTARASSVEQRARRGGDFERFFPKLSQILEVQSTTSSRSSNRGSTSDKSASRRRRHHHSSSTSGHQRPTRAKTAGVQRRGERPIPINPSLLSVLSSLTGTTDRSSGSNSTITQRSFNRRGSDDSRTPTGRPRYPISEAGSMSPSTRRSLSPDNSEHMAPSSLGDDDQDGHSIVSAATASHYESSIAGSSEAPGTPSSHSTFPSPTSTRSHSVAELRRNYDSTTAPSVYSERSPSRSPRLSSRALRRPPSVSDVIEDDEESVADHAVSWDGQPVHHRAESPPQVSANRHGRRRAKTEQIAAYPYYHQHSPNQSHATPSPFSPPRSSSTSSSQSEAKAHRMALQQYQWPAMPVATQETLSPTHEVSPPPAPEAPDLSRTTLTGYEMLALELASPDSGITPLYRKFSHLHHRVLLYLQDEISELEDRLRRLDELAAQLDPHAAHDGHPRIPASRRGEAWHGCDIHYQRSSLLGHLFVKMEQYNRAMAAYTSMEQGSHPALPAQIEAYQAWMQKHRPIHELETRFLHRGDDLVVPGRRSSSAAAGDSGDSAAAAAVATKYAAVAYMPLALVLPVLLFAMIPTFMGRLAVTALVGVGGFMVAATTRIKDWMSAREWGVCGAAYVLLMAAVAGCIPQHG